MTFVSRSIETCGAPGSYVYLTAGVESAHREDDGSGLIAGSMSSLNCRELGEVAVM